MFPQQNNHCSVFHNVVLVHLVYLVVLVYRSEQQKKKKKSSSYTVVNCTSFRTLSSNDVATFIVTRQMEITLEPAAFDFI